MAYGMDCLVSIKWRVGGQEIRIILDASLLLLQTDFSSTISRANLPLCDLRGFFVQVVASGLIQTIFTEPIWGSPLTVVSNRIGHIIFARMLEVILEWSSFSSGKENTWPCWKPQRLLTCNNVLLTKRPNSFASLQLRMLSETQIQTTGYHAY